MLPGGAPLGDLLSQVWVSPYFFGRGFPGAGLRLDAVVDGWQIVDC
jgi:hypothetical protein